MSDFDHTLDKLRMKQRAQYKDHRPPPNQDHKADLNQDFWKESMDGSKINDDFLDKDDVLRTDSKHYKRFEKLVNDSRIFRILLLLFLSTGPLTMAIVSDRWNIHSESVLNMYFHIQRQDKLNRLWMDFAQGRSSSRRVLVQFGQFLFDFVDRSLYSTFMVNVLIVHNMFYDFSFWIQVKCWNGIKPYPSLSIDICSTN